jgi:hypothetical protein
MLERILLVDNKAPLVRAWNEVFRDVEMVEASVGDYFDQAADAMVSPANSFGFMDGGLDLAIRDQLGLEVERRVRTVIEQKHHGEMPIGCAEIIATDHSRWPFLVVAPTMPVPEDGRCTPIRRFAPFCSHQAWLQVTGDAAAPSFQRIHVQHLAMKTID